jgi:hypothetical protein
MRDKASLPLVPSVESIFSFLLRAVHNVPILLYSHFSLFKGPRERREFSLEVKGVVYFCMDLGKRERKVGNLN